MTNEIAEFDLMDEVLQLTIRGKSDLEIARTLNIKRAEVERVRQTWRGIVQASGGFKQKAEDRLIALDEHYQSLVREAWDNYECLKDEGKYKDAQGALKLIGELEKQRVEALQKAGFIEDSDLGADLAETQRQAEAIESLLLELVERYPDTKTFLLPRIKRIFHPEHIYDAVVIEGENA